MSRLDKYADWLINNEDKAGTPDFETVAGAYRELRAEASGKNPDQSALADELFKQQEVPEEVIEDPDFLDQIEEGLKGIGGGAAGLLESAALGAITPLGEETEAYLRGGIQSVGDAAQSLFEADKGSEDLVGRKFGEGLGSYAGIVGASLINPFLGGALAVGAGAGEASERARTGEATEGERGTASLLGAVVGLSELASPVRFAKKLKMFKKALGPEKADKVIDSVRRIATEAGVEGSQEFAAGVAQNLIEQNIYNPEQGTFEGGGEAFGYGAGVGGFVQSILEIAVRTRGGSNINDPLQIADTKLLEDQRQKQLEDQRKPIIAGDERTVESGPTIPLGGTIDQKADAASIQSDRESEGIAALDRGDTKVFEQPDLFPKDAKVAREVGGIRQLGVQPVNQIKEDRQKDQQDTQKFIALARENLNSEGNKNPTELEVSVKARDLQSAEMSRLEAQKDPNQTDTFEDLIASTQQQDRTQKQIEESETETIAGQLDTQQRKTTETKRTAILQDVIENNVVDDTLPNNFSKALTNAGIGNTTPTAAELNTINRAIDFDRAKKPALEEIEAKQYQVGMDGKRLPRTEIPSLGKEVKPKAVLPQKIEGLSATAIEDVAPAPVAEPVDKITTEETPANPVLERAYQKMSIGGVEKYGKLTDEEISELTKVDPYKRTEEQKDIIKKSQASTTPVSAALPSTTTQTDTLSRDTKPTPEKKLSRVVKRGGPKDPVSKIGETLGFTTKKEVKEKVATKIADPKKVAKQFETGVEETRLKGVAKDKVKSKEVLVKQGVSNPSSKEIEEETKKRKETIQSKKSTKNKHADVVKNIKLTEKQTINEKQLATFAQEDVTQKDDAKTNVVNPTPARTAADNIQFYMSEFPNQDSTTQLSMGELTTVLDLVSNPPSDSDISTPSRDKTGRAAAYIYFSKQGNPRDVLDVVAHDIFFAPTAQKPSDYESIASREYFYNANQGNAGLARKWIDANLGQSQVELKEGDTTFKLNFTNVDYEKNTPNIEKLRKLGLTEKEIKKNIPTNPITGKPIPKFDKNIQPKKEEISLPNVTFIPANKTLYNLVQEQANMYLDTTSLENLVDLGVSRKGDSFAFKKLMALKEEREATAPKAVIYNVGQVSIPETKFGNERFVFFKDGKEVLGPFPENVNHPLNGKNIEDLIPASLSPVDEKYRKATYRFSRNLDTSAVNPLDVPVHPVIRSLLKQGKLHEALVALGNSSANIRVAKIANALAKVSGTTKIKIVNNLTADNSSKQVAGKFDPKTNTIFLDADTGINSHVILHEMTHAATAEVLSNMSSQEAKKLKSLYESVKNKLDSAYGAQNLDEFVAEAFSNHEFQQKLAGMQYKNTNGLKAFFNTVANYVRKMLGQQTKDIDTAFNESDQLIQDILSPAPESRNAGELLMMNGKDRINKLGEFISSKYNETASKESKQKFQERLNDYLERAGNSKIGTMAQKLYLRALPLKAVADQIGEVNRKAIIRVKQALKNSKTTTERESLNKQLEILRNNTGIELNDAILELEGALGKADKEVEGTLKQLEPWIAKATKNGTLRAWNEVIHDSTIEGVDPTANESDYANDPIKLAVFKELRKKLYSTGGDGVRNYKLLRDAYATQFEALKDVITERMSQLTDQDTFSKFKKDVFDKMFDKASIRPYFPLMRKGDYWIRYEIPVTDAAGNKTTELVVEAFDSFKARQIRMAELEVNPDLLNKKSIIAYENITRKSFGNVPPTSFVGEVLDILGKANVDEKTQNSILNLFIEVLPESSFAKGFKKRQGVLGAEIDAYEVLRTKGFDIGRQTARMLHSAKISKIQQKLTEETTAFKFDEEINARKKIHDELQIRGDFARNPPPDQIASMANRLAFIGTIGFNISSAVVNLSQIPLMFYPVLGGKYGYKEANSALGAATRMFVGSGLSRKLRTLNGENVDAKGSISIDNYYEVSGTTLILRKDLEAELNKTKEGRDKAKRLKDIAPLIMEAEKQGQIGRSLFYDTLNIETAGKARTAWDTLNAWSAWTFHHMERMNRQVALVASYNLEVDRLTNNPNSKEKALDLSTSDIQKLAAKNACFLTTEMNGGATLSTTSGIAQEGAGRVAMMYKGYGMQMYYTLYKRAREAIRNSNDPDLSVEENKQLKRAALKQVTGIFTSSFLLAGVQGMPLIGGILWIRNLLKDEDEEDAETELRTSITEGFYKGPINYLTGVDIASRIGLSNLLFRGNPYSDPDASLTAQAAEVLTGPAGSMANQVYRGIQELRNGELERAGMNFVPAAIRNMYKSVFKYSPIGDDAILTRRGDVIYDDLNAWELGAQFFGFAPAEYTKTQEMNRATKTQDRDIVSQSSKLLKKYYIAMRMGGDTQDVLEDIIKYNAKFPSMAITPSSIIRSMKMHMKTSLLMHNGITISPKMRAYLMAQRDEWSPASVYDED